MCCAKELGEQLLQITDNVNKLLDEYYKQLSIVDLQISDVLHFIENENFNASQGYKYAIKLKQLRQERRIIKSEIELLKMLKTLTVKSVQPLKCTLGNINKKDEELHKRICEKKYNPRMITKEEIMIMQ